MLKHRLQSSYLREHMDASVPVRDMGAPKGISLCIHAGTVASLLYFKMKT